MSATPETCLVVSTKNGSRTLPGCLAAIERLDGLERCEIILVDNGSTDGTPDILEAFCARDPWRRRTFQELRPGNSAARNAAIRASEAPLILFTDDDCYCDASFVRDWEAIFAADPGLGYGTGRILPHDRSKSMLGCNESLSWIDIPPGRFFTAGLIQGSNMAFRRAAIDQGGLFDERFGAGTAFAGEEWELALRLSRCGWRGGYFPIPTVSHDHGRTDDDAGKRRSFYIVGAGAVFAKYSLASRDPRLIKPLLGQIWRYQRDYGMALPFLKGAFDYIRNRDQ